MWVYYRQRLGGGPLERFVDPGTADTFQPLLDRCAWTTIAGTLDDAERACRNAGWRVQRYPFHHPRSASGSHHWDVVLAVRGD